MSAVPSFPPAEMSSRSAALAQLRTDLVRRFPGAIALTPGHAVRARSTDPHAALRSVPFLWVEAAVGQGGLAWLAAWTLLRLADDPLQRPALWIDTHSTLVPGDLLDLEGRVVVVRPADPHEAHVAADIALRAGSFSLVALEMHRALHPKPLSRLARLAASRRAGAASGHDGDTHTPLVLWGEPPPFLAPPSGIARTPFGDALSALVGDPRLVLPPAGEHDEQVPFDVDSQDLAPRTPHTTDRLRPLDRAADRRPSPPPRRLPRPHVDDAAAFVGHHGTNAGERDDEAPFPFTRSQSR